MKNKKAFTLTELLVALCIVGAIAALSIPSLLNNINNKMLAAQIKSFVGSIEDLAGEQLVDNKTQDLSDTDFATPSSLLSGDNFDIAKTCSSAKDCWTETYRRLYDNAETSYSGYGTVSVVLKNGMIVSYELGGLGGTYLEAFGTFYVDVNGNDGPNIIGRDYFWVGISKKGQIINWSSYFTDDSMITACKKPEELEPVFCIMALMNNNWKMPY